MRLYGQRWVYRIGNQTVTIDNGFSWSFWGQERMLVNDEAIHTTDGYMVPSRSYQEGWLTPLGDGMLHVSLTSGILSIFCKARLDENRLLPDECFVTIWSGEKGSWPENSSWKPIQPSHGIRVIAPRRFKTPSEG